MDLLLPPGLTFARDVISPQQEATLLAACAECQLSYYSQDPNNPRSSASFGWKYDFANDSFLPCAPIPDAFQDACAIAARFGNTTPEAIVECLLNRYEPGAIIQPHCDKPVFDKIIGLSLGSAADMVFSKPAELGGDAVTLTLPPRSIYMMQGEARDIWRHALPHIPVTRWSLTFRTLSPAGEALRAALGS